MVRTETSVSRESRKRDCLVEVALEELPSPTDREIDRLLLITRVAAEAGAIPIGLRRGRSTIERDVLAERPSRGAAGPAIDPGRRHGVHEVSIAPGIPGDHRRPGIRLIHFCRYLLAQWAHCRRHLRRLQCKQDRRVVCPATRDEGLCLDEGRAATRILRWN